MAHEEEKSARKEFAKLETKRDVFLQAAYEAAELTIPFILPRNRHEGQTMPVSYQSLGGRLVNTLSSKLLLTQFPPNSPFFKFQIDDFTLEKLQRDRGLVEEALASMERAVSQELEAKSMRIPLYEALRHLIVAGNALLYLTPENRLRVFHLDEYVILRDPQGTVLKIIVKENGGDPVMFTRRVLCGILSLFLFQGFSSSAATERFQSLWEV